MKKPNYKLAGFLGVIAVGLTVLVIQAVHSNLTD